MDIGNVTGVMTNLARFAGHQIYKTKGTSHEREKRGSKSEVELLSRSMS